MTFGPKMTPGGSRLQAGLPRTLSRRTTTTPQGLLLRGVVVATYVLDDDNHPAALERSDDDQTPRGVVCDVLCYSSTPNARWAFFRGVQVAQDRAGIHSGRPWKP